MPLGDFIPAREADLLNWATNFGSKITSLATSVGLTSAQATAYNALVTAFQTAYATATSRATRSPMNVNLKNVAKHALVENTRMLAGIVQKFPATTNAQRISLGLTVRVVPQSIPAPSSSPLIEITGVSGMTVKVKMRDAAPGSRRGRPLGVAGASVFSFVGATPPSDISQWKFESNTTRTVFDLLFTESLAPGTKVWVTAFWYSARALSGPATPPVGTYLQGGGVNTIAA